jgi:antitoxin component YwqK of YwqJK toxin-antitoxin module
MMHIPENIKAKNFQIPNLTADDPSDDQALEQLWDPKYYDYEPESLKFWVENYFEQNFSIKPLEASFPTEKLYHRGKLVRKTKQGRGKVCLQKNHKKKGMGNWFSTKLGTANAEAQDDPLKNGLIYDGMFLCDAIHQQKAFVYNGFGKLIYKGGMVFGRKYGWGEEFYANGNIMNKGFYKNDKMHGFWCQSYSLKGKLVFEGKCFNGMRHGLGKLFHPNGNLRYFGNFKTDTMHDKKVNIYYENRGLETHCNFFEGRKLGSFAEFQPNGKMKCQGKYTRYGWNSDFVIVRRKNGLVKYMGSVSDWNYIDGLLFTKAGAVEKIAGEGLPSAGANLNNPESMV